MKKQRIAGTLLALTLAVSMMGSSLQPLALRAEENVLSEGALKAEAASLKDAAAYAAISSDYTASWENLNGINSYEPTSSNDGVGHGWGNWQQSAGSEHWVQYEWGSEITTSEIQLYWYDDNGDTRVPSALQIQYQDEAGSWKDAVMVTKYADAQKLNAYNVIQIEEITTKVIRLNMTVASNAAAMGIYRFKVMADISDDFALQAELGALKVAQKVTSDFYLPAKTKSGYEVSWSSDRGEIAIEDGYGIVTRGTEDVEVTLTATITADEKQVTKPFTVTVARRTRDTIASSVDFTKVHINDAFWSARQKQFICEIIPVGIENVEAPTGGIPNLINAAKKNAGDTSAGQFQGTMYFLDSDPYKMIEAMSYALLIDAAGDEEIIAGQKAIADKINEWIPYIEGAQEADGYLDSYFTLDSSPATEAAIETNANKPDKFTDFSRHEMYVAGHFYEAAVAHYRATKDKRLLNVAVKNADLICATFGAEDGKKKAVPGHQEIELALIKLAAACQETGEEEYAKKSASYIRMAKYFLDTRGDLEGRYGKNTYAGFGDEYDQDHKPAHEQTEAVGHAVRAMYMYTAMADVALMEDTDLYDNALLSLWEDITKTKSYVTGGIGSNPSNEGFGDPYYLPNETAYCETCANIGSVMWNTRMNLLYGDSKYADVVERTLYNSVISCVNFDGNKFFYGNPMSSSGSSGRSAWFGCACCPPNLMRLVENLGSYIYTQNQEVLTLNLYIGNEATLELGGKEVALKLETQMPWYGTSKLTVEKADAAEFTLRLRIPEWVDGKAVICLNGEAVSVDDVDEDGYVALTRSFHTGDEITFDFPMAVEKTHTPDEVENNIGYTAIKRGPIVYAAEGADHDFNISLGYIPKESELTPVWADNLMGDGTDPYHIKSGIKLTGAGKVTEKKTTKDVTWTLVPYYAWNNRGAGMMKIYISEQPVVPKLTDYAKVTASYSFGDTLTSVNDGDKKSFWHTWASGTVYENPWIMYTFENPVELTACTVNWMADYNGVVAPASVKIEYYDEETNGWKEVDKTSDNYNSCIESQDNVYTFEKLVTKQIRLTMANGTYNGNKLAVGIYEWQLTGQEYEEPAPTPPTPTPTPVENVDYAKLNSGITAAAGYKQEGYTKESYQKLQEVLAQVRAVAANKAATQKQVDEALQKLQEAEKALVKLKVTSTKKLTIGKGETYSIASKGCYYETSDSSVVTVTQKGKLKGVKTGTAAVKAVDASGRTIQCLVTVKKAPKKILKVTPTKKTLKKGKKFTIRVKLPKGSACAKYTFNSSKKSVATVSAKGVVKAKKKGTTIITVKTYNKKTKKIKVTVK